MAFHLAATYDTFLARVQLVATDLPTDTVRLVIKRGLVHPAGLRGGDRAVDDGDTVYFDDYEFISGELNTYKVTAFDDDDEELGNTTASLTPTLTSIWLKSPLYPFLNAKVSVIDFSDVVTPARGALFDVLGRADPVAVTEIRGSRRYSAVLRASTAAEERAIILALSFGLTMFLHVPPDCTVPRSMHAFVGDVSSVRPRGAAHDTKVRYITLPLTECAPPDLSIVGATITWAGVIALWDTWEDVLEAKASWLELLMHIGDPDDEMVG